MSLSIDNNKSNLGLGGIGLDGGVKGKTTEGTEGTSSAVLKGESVTVTTRERIADIASGRTADASGVRTDKQTEEAIQSLLQCAEQIDAIVDDLKALAEQMGETVPPDGTLKPKLDLPSIKAMTQTFNAQFGTSLGNDFVNALAAGTQSGVKPMMFAADADTSVKTSAAQASTVDAVTSSSKHEVGSAIFSIYEMISLMQEIGQNERDAAHELREAELSCEIASIDLQASIQRDAAKWGMITTIVTCTMQVCMLTATASVAGAAGSSKNLENTSAAQDATQAMNKVENLQAAADGNAEANAQQVDAKTSVENKSEVNKLLNENKEYADAKTALDKAANEHNSLTSQKKEVEAKIKELEHQPEATDEIDAAFDQWEKPSKLQSLKDELNQLDNDVAIAGNKLDSAKGVYQKATEGALEKAYTKVEADYKNASLKTKTCESKKIDGKKTSTSSQKKQDAKDLEEAQIKQKNLGEQRTLIEAKLYEAKYVNGNMPDLKTKITDAKMQYNEVEANQKFDKGYKEASKHSINPMTANILMQVSQMIGSLGQSISSGVSQSIQAEATAEGANQREMQAHRDETNDLFKQAGDLLNDTRQLLQSIIHSESSSVEQIIRA